MMEKYGAQVDTYEVYNVNEKWVVASGLSLTAAQAMANSKEELVVRPE
ncbi:hypothetical protein AAXE64_27665 [Priestia megaterium]